MNQPAINSSVFSLSTSNVIISGDGSIEAKGVDNKMPNQAISNVDSSLTLESFNEYEWHPQTSLTYDRVILNGRTLRYFQTALIIANKGTTQPFIYQPIGNKVGRFKMSIVTSIISQYMSFDCPFYAFGTQYIGGAWNVDIRRAPDLGNVWFSCSIAGTPSVTLNQVLTGSRGSQITISRTDNPIVNSVQVKSIATRLPSQGEVFTTTGGSFTITNTGILGNITDAQANYTGALIPNVGIFWPTTMPNGTFYIRGYTIF